MFSFLSPLLLWALAAALIPLILHMMQRRRIITIPFSTIRFLKLAQKKSATRIRLENILLWLLRTLLTILIALAFAAPVFRTSAFRNFLSTSRRDVSIVWDASYSMGYVSGQKNVWEDSKKTVGAIIESLQPGDRVSMFLADDSGTALIEQSNPDRQMAANMVKVQKPRNSTCQLQSALEAAYNSLSASGREKEIFIVTDGQNLPWTDFRQTRADREAKNRTTRGAINTLTGTPATADMETPVTGEPAPEAGPEQKKQRKDIPVFVAILGVAAPENSAPLAVEIQPSILMANTAAQLRVRIGRTGGAQNASVALFIDNQENFRRSVVLKNDSQNDIVFPVPELPAGSHTARIETSPDALKIDNTFFLLLNVRDTLPVLCVGSENDSFFLIKALNPSGNETAIAARRIEPGDVGAEKKMGDYAAVFLCNALPMAGEALVPLEQYVQKGGLLTLFPGDRATPGDYVSWDCLPARPQSIEEPRGPDARQMLRLVKPGDALFRSMKLPPGAIPTIAVKRMLTWGKMAKNSEIIVDSDRNKPFLLRRDYGKGHILCFSVSADRRWSNFPLSAFFLPIVHQVIRFGSELESARPFLWSARGLVISDFPGVTPESGEISAPTGKTIPIARIKSGNNVVLSVEDATLPGMYLLKGAGAKTQPLFAINVSRAESDLTRIEPNDIPKLIGGGKTYLAQSQEDLLRLINEHRMGRPLSEQLLWAVFLVGILEFFMANRANRKTATLSQQLHVESSGRVKGKATA